MIKINSMSIVFAFLMILVSCVTYRFRTFVRVTQNDYRNGEFRLVLSHSGLETNHESPQPNVLMEGLADGLPFAVEHYPLLPTGINLNRANASLLTLIHGVGPVRAQRITAERKENGFFTCPDDFTDRTGVCVKRYRNWVFAGEPRDKN
jgi:hypothetical protein